MSQDWTRTATCKIHLDMHCPDWSDEILSRFDARSIVEKVANSGADALYFFAKDCYGNAYYPTSIGKLHPCLQGRDFLQEILDEAKQRNLLIIAYYSVIWDNEAAQRHPEWRMLGPDQRALSDTVTSELGKWQYLCHNSGYAEYAAAMVREIAENYHVQGFHLDMFNCDFGGLSCYCSACEKAFEERTGKPLPREASWDPLWREFLEFRYESVERLMLRLGEAGRAKDSHLPVVMNYHGAPDFDWRVGQLPVRHSRPSSMATGETYTPMFGDLYPAMEGRFIRAIAEDRPFEMVSWRMNRITDFTLKGLPQLRWEVLTGLIHGGSTMLIDQPHFDGQLDSSAYQRIGEVFEEAHQLMPTFRGDFVPHVGLYYSSKTRDWYARGEQQKFMLPLMGAYKALVESHLQVDFIPDEIVNAELLSRYSLIFLPDVAILSEQENLLLRDYVANGGSIIATLNTSRYSLDGEPLNHFALSDLFGVMYRNTISCDNCYYQLGQHSSEAAIHAEHNVLCQGEANQIETTSAQGEGLLREAFYVRHVPDRFFSHNVHPPYRQIGQVVYRNAFGRGKSIYLPFGLDRSYADIYELPEHRLLLSQLVASVSDSPFANIQAPSNCEVVLRQEGNVIRAHLTMFNPLRQSVTLPSLNRPIRPSIRMDEAAIFEVTLKMKQPFDSVRNLREDTLVSTEGQQIKIICRDVHECLEISLAGD